MLAATGSTELHASMITGPTIAPAAIPNSGTAARKLAAAISSATSAAISKHEPF